MTPHIPFWRRALALLLLGLASLAQAGDTLTLGVYAVRPKPVMLERYQPLADYLSAQLDDIRVELRVLDHEEMEAALEQHQLDLLMTDPSHYLIVRSRDSLSGALATVISTEDGRPASSLGGVIITRAGRDDIGRLEDLRKRRIAIPGMTYLGAYQTQAFELLEKGIELPRQAKLVIVPGHDAVVDAVLEGRADAGFIGSGLIESLVAEGRLDASQLKVIHGQQLVGFPYEVSTRLYPEWPFVALSRVSQDTVRRITAALLTLEGTDPAARAAKIGGFAPPADYLPVERLARALRLPPHDAPPVIALRDVWNEYAPYLLASGTVLTLIIGLLLLLSRRNRQLHQLVHEKGEVQSRLHVSETRLLNTLNGAPSVAVQWFDRQGRVLYWNAGSERLYLWKADEAMGKTLDELALTSGMSWDFQSMIDRIADGEERVGPLELSIRDRNGALHTVEATVFSIPGHETNERIFVCMDVNITQRKQFEQALTEGRDHLDRLLASNPSVIYALSPSTLQATFVSSNCSTLFGQDSEAILANPRWWLDSLHPDDRERAVGGFMSWCGHGFQDSLRHSYRVRRGADAWVWIEDQLVAARDSSGKVVELVGSHTDVSESRRIANELAETKSMLETALMNSPAGILIADAPDLRIRFANTAALAIGATDVNADVLESEIRLDEYHRQWHIAHPDGSIWPLEDLPLSRAVLRGERVFNEEIIITDANGEKRWISSSAAPIADPEGTIKSGIVVFHDITQRKAAEARLELAASVFSHAREAIMITDAQSNILEVNEAFTRITGFTRAEAVGNTPAMLRSGRQNAEFYASMWCDLIDKGYWEGELWNRHKNGDEYAQTLTIAAVRSNDGHASHYVSLSLDITRQKEIEDQLRRNAHFDSLTGLPNRVLLADRLTHAMSRARRDGRQLGLAYIDLDGFKEINDSFGHEAGDQLLIALAARMKAALRDSDTVSRLGGDEFIAVLADQNDQEASIALVQRLLKLIIEPVAHAGCTLRVSASIGLSFFPQPGVLDADQLMRQADQAMYHAKLSGKNRYHVFNPVRHGDGKV